MAVIDAYAHAFPRSLLTELRETHDPDGIELFESPRFWDIDHRIDALDRFGIDRQVIMQGRTGIWDGFSAEGAHEYVRLGNDAMRSMADDAGDRLIPVGTVPFLTGEYVNELERCQNELGLAGIQIPSHIRGRPLDDPAFRPFFEKAEALEVPIWIHPHTHPHHEWASEYANHKTFGWLFETTLAQTRIVYSGMLDELPELKVVTHHMGGMVPFFAERITDFYEVYADDTWPTLERPVVEYFKMFYADTVLSGAVCPLRCGIEFFGTDQVVFGTDYPFGPEEGRRFLRELLPAVEALELEPHDHDQICEGNIIDLVD